LGQELALGRAGIEAGGMQPAAKEAWPIFLQRSMAWVRGIDRLHGRHLTFVVRLNELSKANIWAHNRTNENT